MTRDEILSLAREAGFSVRGETIRTMHSSGAWVGINDELAKFAALAITRHLAHSPPAPLVVSMSDVDQAQLAAMLANAPAMPLVAAPDDSELAACFDQIKYDLIADGAVEHDLGLEFFPEAVLDAFRRQRAARIEAQQRLADAQELAAKSGLAHRKAVQEAVAEAVAAERDACAEILALASSKLLAGKRTSAVDRHTADVLARKADEIRARGAA